MKRVLFLLGAGASKPAGYPLTDEITDRVLTAEGVMWHTDGTYVLSNDKELQALWPVDPDLAPFVTGLYDHITPFFRDSKPGRRPNYEDVAYLVSQVADSIDREYENPALEPFIDLLGSTYKRERGGVWRLASEALSYIRDVVWKMVGGEPVALQAFGSLREACLELGGGNVTVVTLNHDRLIDRAFAEHGIPYSEGFEREYGDLRVWDDSFPTGDTDQVQVLRPHGCVDWFRYQLPSLDGYGKSDVVACCRDQDYGHLRSPDGDLIDPPPTGRPEMLVGTFTKMLNYGRGIYADTHARFHAALRESDALVVVGYGFGDKGINSRVIDWLSAAPERRACVVHPSPYALMDTGGRAAARANLRHFHKIGRVAIVPKRTEDADWSEIALALS